MTGAEILKNVMHKEKFEVDEEKSCRQPRVSSIGYCMRKNVAKALGIIPNSIAWYYCEAGYALQERAFARIKKQYPRAEQEVSVPTSTAGVYTHPDIYIPELNFCIQVKSGRDSSSTFGTVKYYHRDQVLLEWYFWQQAGYCITQDKSTIMCIPDKYELLYLGRESYGENMISVPVHYDTVRAESLARKFDDMASYIEIEELPPPPSKPSFECRECPLSQKCWY